MNPRTTIALLAAAGTFGAALVLVSCSTNERDSLPVAKSARATDPALVREGPIAPPHATVETPLEPEVPSPGATKAAWREGLALFENRDYAEAAERLAVAARGRGEDATTHYVLGLSRLKSGDAEGAEAAFVRSTEIDPARVKTFVNLARARMDRGDPDGARDAAAAAIDLDPENVSALHQLGRALMARDRRDEALAALARAHDLDPNDGYAANTLGWVLLQAGRTNEALPVLERAKGRLPSVTYVRNNLGIAYERLGRPEDAAAEFTAAVASGDPEGKAAQSFARVTATIGNPTARTVAPPSGVETARK